MDIILLHGYLQQVKNFAEKVMKRVPELIADFQNYQEQAQKQHGEIMVK